MRPMRRPDPLDTSFETDTRPGSVVHSVKPSPSAANASSLVMHSFFGKHSGLRKIGGIPIVVSEQQVRLLALAGDPAVVAPRLAPAGRGRSHMRCAGDWTQLRVRFAVVDDRREAPALHAGGLAAQRNDRVSTLATSGVLEHHRPGAESASAA